MSSSGGKKHTLYLVDRAVLTITAVDDLISFDESAVTLAVDDKTLNVSGENLTVTRLSLEEGEVVISGEIDAIVYFGQQQKKRGLLDRFKN